MNRQIISAIDGNKSKTKREKARFSIVIGVIVGLVSVSTFVLTAVSDGKLICCGMFGVFGFTYAVYKAVFRGALTLWIYKE